MRTMEEPTFLLHAREQMTERGISQSAARETLENPDREYPGDWGRTVAERTASAPASGQSSLQSGSGKRAHCCVGDARQARAVRV
jgi:hypothetical protein